MISVRRLCCSVLLVSAVAAAAPVPTDVEVPTVALKGTNDFSVSVSDTVNYSAQLNESSVSSVLFAQPEILLVFESAFGSQPFAIKCNCSLHM